MKTMKRKAAVPALLLMLGLVWAVPSAYASADALELRHTGEEDELVAAGSALFSHAENGLPGDTFTGKLAIENASEGPCEFFTATTDVVTNGPDDTLERIAFTVTSEEDALIFDGTLDAAGAAEPISLGVVEPGKSVNVDYAVVIPPELTNEYADTAVGLNVAIAAVDRSEAPLVSTSGTSQGAGLGQTGETLLRVLIALGVAGVAAAGIVVARRKGWRWLRTLRRACMRGLPW